MAEELHIIYVGTLCSWRYSLTLCSVHSEVLPKSVALKGGKWIVKRVTTGRNLTHYYNQELKVKISRCKSCK
jgi:hypothetical protein